MPEAESYVDFNGAIGFGTFRPKSYEALKTLCSKSDKQVELVDESCSSFGYEAEVLGNQGYTSKHGFVGVSAS